MFVPIANSPTRSLFSSVWRVRPEVVAQLACSPTARSTRRLLLDRGCVSGVSSRLPYFSHRQSPTTPSMTNVPLTSPGVVKISPPGRLPHFSGLMMPLVLSQLVVRD